MRPVLLLVTTRTYRAGAFLRAAERLGLPVVVATDQPLAWSQDQTPGLLSLDFHNVESASSAIAAAAEPSFLSVLAAEDEGLLTAAAASTRLGLVHNSPDSVLVTRDKAQMRQRLDQANLPNPPHWVVPLEADPEEAASQVIFPCVVKPRSLSGSRGVIRADDPASFVAAFRRTARIIRLAGTSDPHGMGETLLVEGYIPGSEHALEGLLTAGRMETLALFDKPDPLEGPYFEETLFVTPSRLSATMQSQVGRTVGAAVGAIGLTHGPLHAEVRVHAGQVWIVEIAARSIGGLCSRALRFEGGRSLEEILLAHAVGLPLPSLALEPVATGVMMIPIPGSGVLRKVHGVQAARGVPGITDVVITLPAGGDMVALPEGASYLGFLFGEADTPLAVETALRAAHRSLRVEYDAAPPV